MPDPMNPQALNRYSYCVNNALKYVDPSGKDYIIIGEAGSTPRQKAAWDAQIRRHLTVEEGERIEFLPDVGTTVPVIYDVAPRLDQLTQELATGSYTDIKLIGFSEGAAAVGVMLSELAKGSLGDNVQSVLSEELEAAFLLETPAGFNRVAAGAVRGFEEADVNGLPKKLRTSGYDVTLGDIWVRESLVHQSIPIYGWEDCAYSYNSISPMWGLDQWWAFPLRAILTPTAFHSDVWKSDEVWNYIADRLN